VVCEPVSWCRQAFVVPAAQRQQLVQTAAAADGRLYVQNLSSLLPVLLLDPQPGETVLDLTAAPGGKTLHLVAQMQNRGHVSAVDVVRSRYYRLRENLRRGQARIVRTYLTDGRTVGRKTPERFDRVLLDAPCSSEGRFRSGRPDTWRYWGLRKIREQARKQQGLLRSAMRALRPGGTLVYCTCSFAPEENELIVDTQLRRNPDAFQLRPIQLPVSHVEPGLTEWQGRQLTADLRAARRVLPQDAMDAFFLCKLSKVVGN
jgi:16S rRNA (cytosine1407-C5)-methyltransferase